MSMTDPIADFLTRIRNGLHAGHDEVVIPHSKMKIELARILQEQGYIEGYSVERGPRRRGAARPAEVHGEPRARSSPASSASRKPGRRIYVASGESRKRARWHGHRDHVHLPAA